MDISIIICSRNRTTNTELVQNIHDTIGTSYEIIHIDNESGQYGISAAYNKGVEEAKGDILCFMHDDVRYHSDGWGLRVKDYFSCTNLGMLGVAGSMIVPERGDWRFLDPRYHVIRLIQGISSPRGKYYARGMLWKATGGLKQVAILDGVWFCIRKKTFQSVRFDDVSFPHFHFYDSDISMQINALGQNVNEHSLKLSHSSALVALQLFLVWEIWEIIGEMSVDIAIRQRGIREMVIVGMSVPIYIERDDICLVEFPLSTHRCR